MDLLSHPSCMAWTYRPIYTHPERQDPNKRLGEGCRSEDIHLEDIYYCASLPLHLIRNNSKNKQQACPEPVLQILDKISSHFGYNLLYLCPSQIQGVSLGPKVWAPSRKVPCHFRKNPFLTPF